MVGDYEDVEDEVDRLKEQLKEASEVRTSMASVIDRCGARAAAPALHLRLLLLLRLLEHSRSAELCAGCRPAVHRKASPPAPQPCPQPLP